MKNNKRNIFSALASAALALSFSVVAFAAEIDESKAIDIAVSDANYKASDVIYSKAEFDFDDGREKWDVEFLVKDSDGLYREYSYELSAKDGHIIEKEWDIEDDYIPSRVSPEKPKGEKAEKVKDKQVHQQQDIGKDKAKELAVKSFDLDEKDVKILKIRKDYDKGVEVYEIKFRQGLKAKYSCDVLAYSGEVAHKDAEYVDGFFNKVEFGFELFGDWLEGLFDW